MTKTHLYPKVKKKKNPLWLLILTSKRTICIQIEIVFNGLTKGTTHMVNIKGVVIYSQDLRSTGAIQNSNTTTTISEIICTS